MTPLHLRRVAAFALASLAAVIAPASSEVACGSGGTCVDIDLSTYDRTCSKDSDCTLIDYGHLCNGDCLCGRSPAVNVDGLARYQAAISKVTPGRCECSNAGVLICLAGQCEQCAYVGACATDAGLEGAGRSGDDASDAACD
jgi:hypothetical protein